MRIRNSINSLLKTTAVIRVTISERGNYVLHSIKPATELINQFHLWKPAVPGAIRAIKPGSWKKVIVHGVPYYLTEFDIFKIFKDEVETFNPIKVIRYWNILKKPRVKD